MRPNDPISNQPLDTAPYGYLGRTAQRTALLTELDAAGVATGAYDLRIVDWLASWDWPTVATVASLIRRASSPPPITPDMVTATYYGVDVVDCEAGTGALTHDRRRAIAAISAHHRVACETSLHGMGITAEDLEAGWIRYEPRDDGWILPADPGQRGALPVTWLTS